jgi:formate hydrogenlyase subunit 6/NADH:ubiquinone oxidoreductase subunit I
MNPEEKLYRDQPETLQGLRRLYCRLPTRVHRNRFGNQSDGLSLARFAVRKCIACGMCFYTCPEFGPLRLTKARKGA